MKAETILKIREWSIKHYIIKNILWYLFFPITIPAEIFMNWAIKWVTFKQLDKAIEADNEHAILSLCVSYGKFHAEKHKWKHYISKKWFSKTMRKHELKMYNYCIRDKQKMDLNYFRTLLDIYIKYNPIGGAVLNKEGSTTVTIN